MNPVNISRSAVVTRKTCEMKRYLNYEATLDEAQTTPGLVPLSEGTPRSLLPRLRGQILHAVAEKIFLQDPWEAFLHDACQVLDPSMRDEQEVLIRRALKGWVQIRGELLADFTTISSEAEWSWALSPEVSQSLRLDRVLRRTDDGTLAILDFKTMRAPDKNWIERLLNSEQTHLYIQALRERSQEWVMGMIYEGIIIGTLDESGHQKSPFVMGYQKRDGSLSPTYVAGAPKVYTLGWPDDQWLQWASDTGILRELYCTTGPLLPPFAQLLATKANTIGGELRWHGRMTALARVATAEGRTSDIYQERLAQLVEKNPDACLKYGWEYACPYHRICWDGATPDADTYRAREDHHA